MDWGPPIGLFTFPSHVVFHHQVAYIPTGNALLCISKVHGLLDIPGYAKRVNLLFKLWNDAIMIGQLAPQYPYFYSQN